ncbi:uncharacterized protein LOC111045438 isoform X2 [Nilaparvata lugens]|uniref:uncharacterized protein LOC111045438 isoform X1 n=2 Tax=Nilaparvata lugens TaxID=108931 RepID=UPI00193E3E20|nr:uncharacterized protein LOC111045438 isoform X1 [Nilaparvata lugens]XP_039279884.1 uncharacterized protein LOC111045438 isoform X2 [Nilaparvata lugens]
MTEEKKEAGVALISLKCVLFLFFGGLGCILAFLPLHMRDVGLTGDESRIVSIVAPCVAIIGPLLFGPLADRWGAGSAGTQHSQHMRGLLAFCLVLGAVAYSALLAVPTVSRLQQRNPELSFRCNQQGAFVVQEKCQETPCHDWPRDNFGSIFLSYCRYDCPQNGTKSESLFITTPETVPDNDDDDDSEGSERVVTTTQKPKEDYPHMCFTKDERTICHVYTEATKQLTVNVTLTTTPDTYLYDPEWCRYPLGGKVSCPLLEKFENCDVVCDLAEPFSRSDSILLPAKCQKTIGNDQLTFWSYLAIRSIADIFPTTTLALLDSCLITATRDSPGLLGPQLAVAAAGLAIFPVISLFVSNLTSLFFEVTLSAYASPILMFALLSLGAALIVIFDKSMPLSPVDYWLHSGSSYFNFKGGGGEITVILFILVLLGTFWSCLDSYLPWYLVLELEGNDLLLALTFVAGALPSLPFLWFAETIVFYCGHTNLFITAFTFYIIRYTGLLFFSNPWWILLCEGLEVFTLSIMWASAILYIRQVIPRHLTTVGQSLAVIAHFCLGRSIGAVLGGILSQNDSLIQVYRVCAVVAAFVATAYYIIYYCCIKPKCLKPPTRGYRNPHNAMQGSNTNGTYTPLKVYNKQGDKGSNNQASRY